MVDFQTLLESACDDAEIAAELLSLFEQQVHGEMNGMADAIREGDAARVASVAHKLVGSAVACGFVDLSKELRSMELRCLSDMPDDIEARVGRVGLLLEEGCIRMNAYLVGGAS